ncbi:hypothetical protein [Candidatus Clostridium radicumherbarum]|uniref:Glycogen debranching protein n=1 Tax=Candidatus Clostridium radicumherbarum TaxID=3381662 RepID=A0ABW8TPK2_9CLOT
MLESYKISKRYRLDDPCICTGDRTYLIGTQDGMFPDMGEHVRKEMGGLWNHPIKLADGFWAVIKDKKQSLLLNKSLIYNTYPAYQEFIYDLKSTGLRVNRKDFCPDGIEGIVVKYTLENMEDEDKKFDFHFLLRTDLRPVWFSEKLNIEDGNDSVYYNERLQAFCGKDERNPWYIVWGSSLNADSWEVSETFEEIPNTHGKGANGRLRFNSIKVKAKDKVSLYFFIAGSYASEHKAFENYLYLKDNYEKLLKEKLQRYETIISQGNIRVPELRINEAIDWLKFNYDWLVRYVPKVGRGLGAGFPEYPWWFGCDNEYALLGLLPTGRFDIIEDTLRLLKNTSEKINGNGRIVHEISTNGAVAYEGNTQETAQFVKVIWQVFKWTGNEAFLREMFPYMEKSIHWLLNDMDRDKDLLPSGYGIIEIEGLNCENIDTAVFTHKALEAYAEMIEYLKLGDGGYWRKSAERLKTKINKEFWREEEGVYGDFIATPEEVLERYEIFKKLGISSKDKELADKIEELKEEALNSESSKDKTFNMKNWTINTPLGEGIADFEKANKALDSMESSEYRGRFGLKLGATKHSGMMTISTAAQAEAEGQYGRIEKMLGYIDQIISTFSIRMPGSFSEMSPDYGCFVQAWTGYGVIWPIVTYLFGIQPCAYRKEIYFNPLVPIEWNYFQYKNVKIGTAIFNFYCKRNENKDMSFTIECNEDGWVINSCDEVLKRINLIKIVKES